MIAMIGVGIGLEKGHFPEIMAVIEPRVQAIVDEGQDLEQTNMDRIRWYKCREYDHFMRDSPTSREEREIEHLQQMLNLEESQTSPVPHVQNSLAESPRASLLNL